MATRCASTASPLDNKTLYNLSLVPGAHKFSPRPPSRTPYRAVHPPASVSGRIFLLQLLELLGLINLQHPEFTRPSMEGLLAELPLPADILDLSACNIHFPKDANLRFCRLSFAFHFLDPLSGPD